MDDCETNFMRVLSGRKPLEKKCNTRAGSDKSLSEKEEVY